MKSYVVNKIKDKINHFILRKIYFFLQGKSFKRNCRKNPNQIKHIIYNGH